METNNSGYPVEDEIQLFMKYHEIPTMEELIDMPREQLFEMPFISMHIMSRIFEIRKEKGQEIQ